MPAFARAAPCLLLLAAWSATAAEVNGYVDGRTQLTRVRATGLLPTDDLPQLSQLIELNTQVRQSYSERGFLYGDLSLLAQLAGNYRGQNAAGEEVTVPAHDVPANHPLVALNELYVSHEVRPELNLLLGKKRLTWGAGMAFNPTDLLNPPKDPTDPTFQRAGAYMARIEVPFERWALTLVASPAVLQQRSGIPTQLLAYPSWEAEDDHLHYQLALRGYALVENADLNLMVFYGNRYADAFERKLRVGASFSRYFFDDYELHVEGLFQTGSARDYVEPGCVTDPAAALRCVLEQTPIVSKRRLEEATLLPRVLVGTRRQFGDESMLSLEYLYQADGYSRAELQNLVSALYLVQQARRAGLAPNAGALGGTSQDGVPQKFSFEPFGRHYLFATFQKPKIRDDFTAQAVVIASLQDLSGMIVPSVSWSATEWLTLTLSGFVPFPGPRALAARMPESEEPVSEYTLLPIQYRGLFELRVFY